MNVIGRKRYNIETIFKELAVRNQRRYEFPANTNFLVIIIPGTTTRGKNSKNMKKAREYIEKQFDGYEKYAKVK